MREISTRPELLALCGNDTVCIWVAKGTAGNGNAWTHGNAVAVCGTGLARRNRIAIAGDPDDAAVLVDQLFVSTDPLLRIMGDADLVTAVGKRLHEFVVSEEYGWMEAAGAVPESWRAAVPGISPAWLDATELAEVTALIENDFPASYARPGADGVRRWVGARDSNEVLVAAAAEAWTVPGLGFLSGVVTRGGCRGRGYAGAVCAMAMADLAGQHGAVALMVDSWNTTAIRLYRRLGLTWRGVRSAKHAR